MRETLFTVLGLPVTGFALGMAGTMLLVLGVMYLWCRAQKLGYGVFIRFAALALPLTLLSSRLLFVLAESTYYLTTLSNPALALRFWDGGYSLVGALLGLMLAAGLAQRLWKLPRHVLLDGLALAAPLGILAERLCEHGTYLGLGRPIATPWLMFLGMEDPLTGSWVHPVYLYEAAAAAILFVVMLLRARGVLGRKGAPGDELGVFTVLFAASQVVLECMRNDGHMVVHFVPIQQVTELVMLLTVLGLWTARLARSGRMKKSRIAWIWLGTAVCVGTAVAMEFLVDRGALKLLYYSVMTLCMAAVAAAALWVRRRAA